MANPRGVVCPLPAQPAVRPGGRQAGTDGPRTGSAAGTPRAGDRQRRPRPGNGRGLPPLRQAPGRTAPLPACGGPLARPPPPRGVGRLPRRRYGTGQDPADHRRTGLRQRAAFRSGRGRRCKEGGRSSGVCRTHPNGPVCSSGGRRSLPPTAAGAGGLTRQPRLQLAQRTRTLRSPPDRSYPHRPQTNAGRPGTAAVRRDPDHLPDGTAGRRRPFRYHLQLRYPRRKPADQEPPE